MSQAGSGRRILNGASLLLAFALGSLLGLIFQHNYGLGSLLPGARVLIVPATATPHPASLPGGVPEEFQGKLSLFILAGQSNMSGRGVVPELQREHSQIFLFGNDYRWRLAVEPVDSPDGQVDVVSLDGPGDLAGFGPGLPFARSLLEVNPESLIGLIPCAKGDTTIEQWQRRLGDEALYGSCLKRVRAASVVGDIAALLFFQGEADAVDPQQDPGRTLSAANYAARFTTFAEDFRRDLERPDLPIVFAQIGSHAAPEVFTQWVTVQEQQASIRLPCSAMITTSDLPLGDLVHYTTASYQAIGRRFATAYLGLTSGTGCHQAPN